MSAAFMKEQLEPLNSLVCVFGLELFGLSVDTEPAVLCWTAHHVAVPVLVLAVTKKNKIK